MAGAYVPLGLLGKDSTAILVRRVKKSRALVIISGASPVTEDASLSGRAPLGFTGKPDVLTVEQTASAFVPLGILNTVKPSYHAGGYTPLGVLYSELRTTEVGGAVQFTAIAATSPQRADIPIGTSATLNIEGTVEDPPIDTTVKGPVVAATTSAGSLASDFEDGDTIDVVTLSTGDRILIKNQADASENGIYIVNASGAPTRAEDADQDAEVFQGVTVQIAEGTTNGGTAWNVTSADPIEVDADDIDWGQNVDPVHPVNRTGWIYRNSETYSGPSLTDGRPDSEWQPSSTVTEVWGRPRILINGRDRTYYRGGTAQINSMTITEPFGDGVAQIRLPKVTPFDNLDSLLPKWAEIEIQRVRSNGTRQTLWMGSIASWESDTEGVMIQCAGAFYEADRFLRKPVFYDVPASIENHITTTINYFSTYYDLNLAIMDWVPTGISLRARGSYEKVATGYIADLVAKAQKDSGGGTKQYTVECQNRQPALIEKNTTTTHWTVQTGGRGVDHSISADHLEGKANQFYAEGIDEQNCHWRNSRYLADFSQAFIWPIVATVQTESIQVIADPTNYHRVLGFGSEPGYDPSLPRIEAYQNFGAGTPKSVAIEAGVRLLGEFFLDGWIGSITLTSDPQEGSRFNIRAGENILLKDFQGDNILFHIVEAAHDFQSLTTTLTVDTMARDRMDVVAIHQRNSEARENPTAKLNLGRRSKHTEDRISVWDCESGFGIVPEQNLMGGYYSMWGVPAGEVGQVVRSEFFRTPYFGSPYTTPIEFEVMIFDREINLWDIVAIGIPSDDEAFWEPETMEYLYSLGMLIGWENGGYWPGDDPDNDPLTGILRDDASWYYETLKAPWLWLVAHTNTTAPFSGRMYPAGAYEVA